jgi:SAM-dependent methyltransferase
VGQLGCQHGDVTAGDSTVEEQLAEQQEFYRADAEPFDEWLGSLVDEGNDEPAALGYRAGRALISDLLERWAPLGRVLEIAGGTGRLAELYVPHAASAVLLDTAPESLDIARRRLAEHGSAVELTRADVFTWEGGRRAFDTIVFSAWLHHVPHARFETFWHIVESRLAEGGRVIFDFPDVNMTASWETDVPEEPTEEYGFYAPVDGISIRDHFGRRWRVVHNLWDPHELEARLADLGWSMTVLGPGLADNVVWATAHRVDAPGR